MSSASISQKPTGRPRTERRLIIDDPFTEVIPAASFPSKHDPLAERLSADGWTHTVEELVSQYRPRWRRTGCESQVFR